ncbi:MAG: CocE/NonD family hydrolase [Gemmatimonadota bacterium]
MRLFRVVSQAGSTIVAVAMLGGQVHAQAPSSPLDSLPPMSDTTLMLPLRDGVALNTRIFIPKSHDGPLPIIMMRTPYGIANAEGNFRLYLHDLAADGYIFVFQDIRGRNGSQGAFIMNRPLHDPRDEKGVDETTDTWDTIDWLVKHIPGNNGKVGVLGISYPGWLAGEAAIHPHPALKAISPQAPMTDTWMGDDFFHNGAFRLGYGFEYSAFMELSNDNSVPPPIPSYDSFEWYLHLGGLRWVDDSIFKGKVPSWKNFVAHPAYDEFWRSRGLENTLRTPTVPTMDVAGFWDQEDMSGPEMLFAAMEPRDTGGLNFFVGGPWNHGGWARGDGRTLGNIDFGSATSEYFRQKIQAPWFAYWLKGRGPLPFKKAIVYESGSGRWRQFDHWPPKEARATNLYFRADGKLSFDAPAAMPATANDHFIADPAHPVPYRQRPTQWAYDSRGSNWYTWLTEDQRLVQLRPDVLSWQTAPLDHDVTIAGDVVADLFAATTGRDADWIVKLIDVYPDSVNDVMKMAGYQLMVSDEIFRGRYRTSFEHPAPITPNAVLEYTYSLRQQSYSFRKGHRIMVQVQSSWFPAYDLNPQTWVANIFKAGPADFKAQTHSIYRTAKYPSHVVVSVVGEE